MIALYSKKLEKKEFNLECLAHLDTGFVNNNNVPNILDIYLNTENDSRVNNL